MNKLIKKGFLNLGAVSLGTAPLTFAFSCTEELLDKSGLQKNDLLVLVDSTTVVDTNAFTQGIIKSLENQANKDDFKMAYQQVQADDRNGREKTIQNAIDNGTNVFAIASFSFSDDLKYLSEKFPNAKFIAIDTKSEAGLTNIANVWAESQEGAFLAGYLTAKEASDRIKDNKNVLPHNFTDPKKDKIKFGYVGGFNFETVTRFYDGIVSGMKYWNEKNVDGIDYDIEFIYDKSSKDDAGAYANTWSYDDPQYKTAFQTLINANVHIVCGSPESVAAYNAKNPKNKLWQIANDSDIKDSETPEALEYTFTSILKDIGDGAAQIAHEWLSNKSETSFTSGKVEGKGINTGVMGVALDNLNEATYNKIFKNPYNLVDGAENSDVAIYNGIKLKDLYAAAKDAWHRNK